ncbi:MAG: ATP-dependent RecD-like DNA helicase [Thermoanaerobaculia bacterium]
MPQVPALEGSPPAQESLDGVVERVVYADPESAWSVVRLRLPDRHDSVTAVGPLLGVQPGEELRLNGQWVRDRRYGRQFRVSAYLVRQPDTLKGIERYLGSGQIPGIGKVMAKRLVAAFGLETLEVIDGSPERLREVEGIGPVRAERIRKALQEQQGIREVLVFLQSHGVSTSHAIRIWRHLGAAAVAAVRQNPYRLASEITGIGFKSAERIAASLGLPRDAPERADAGVLYLLDQAASQGHIFLPRGLLVERTAALLETKAAAAEQAIDRLVARREAITDRRPGADDAVYRPELHAAETALATRIDELLARPAARLEIDPDGAVAWFERRRELRLADQQRQAIRQTLSSKLSILTGGPGTGKTTLLRAVVEIFTHKGQQVLLAAPTGRAANRLSAATNVEAKTVHRLLEFDPRQMAFQRARANPLKADLIVIDEASMLDCRLAHHLLAAVPDRARLLLVGDVDQLPSVGPGRVLADLIECGRVAVARLSEIFRQAARSQIVANAHRIRRGDMPLLGYREPDADFFLIQRTEPEEIVTTVKQLVTQRIPTGFGVDPRRDIQVLSPMRRGLVGSDNLNRELQALLNPDGAEIAGGRGGLRIGDRVMQVKNNYPLEVFNGDVGTLLGPSPTGSHVRVDFEGRIVEYETADLEELTMAYACSVHKAQGSEYPCVVVPIHTQHFMMLQRNLLYTAVTRARRLVVLVGDPKAVALAVRNQRQQERFTLLKQRLQA